jgi:hypothetical protein
MLAKHITPTVYFVATVTNRPMIISFVRIKRENEQKK